MKKILSFKKIFITLFLSSFIVGVFGHDYYISVCQIDHNPKSESLEITLKIFTDDLEKTLESHFKTKTHLGTAKESADSDSLIVQYLDRNFQLSVNGNKTPFEYLGKEVELNATWCYLEIPKIDTLKKIFIKNTVLTEMFDSQTNIVHINNQIEQKSLMLHRNKQSGKKIFSSEKWTLFWKKHF